MEIHRSRFVPYPSSAINALAFSHATKEKTTGEDPSSLRLAIGRANGNIEIWNPGKGIWVQEKTFSGGKERSVEGLAWIQEPGEEGKGGKTLPGRLRLFSIGYSSSITEWNLVTGLPARSSGGNHSEVWCFAAQPQWVGPKKKSSAAREGEFRGQNLVAGCADGTLAMISTAEEDLRFQKLIARPTKKKARVLSVAFQDRNRVVAGYADSTIRVFDSRTGESLRSISLGSGPKGGPTEILVWKIRCLPNGDIVSGDSLGELRFFGGESYSQIQRLAGHEADILDLAVSNDGQYIFTGGMDRRTALFKCIRSNGKKEVGHGSWVKVSHSKFHDHDVKALATYNGKDLSVTVSGGIDTQPIVVPIREFGKEYSRSLPFLPQTPPLASAPGARLLVSWWNCEIRIWRIPRNTGAEQRPKLVAKMALLGEEHITSAAISQNGLVLAVATVAKVKFFQLASHDTSKGEKFSISKLHSTSLPGATLVQFSGNGKWLAIITPTANVLLARLVPADDSNQQWTVLPRLVTLERSTRTADPSSLNGFWGNYYRTITHADFSDDSTVLAVGDLGGHIDVWVVEGNEDPTAAAVDVAIESSSSTDDEESGSEDDQKKQSIVIMGQHWRQHPNAAAIPKLDSAPLVLSFRPASSSSQPQPNGNPGVHATRHNPHPRSHELPGGEQRFMIVSAKHSVYEFDLLNGGYSGISAWSRRNPTSQFPTSFIGNKDRTKGCVWDIHEGNERVWLYGVNWLFMLDLSKDLPDPETLLVRNGANQLSGQELSKKRKRKSGEEGPRKKSSGAGDAIPASNVLSSVGKFTGGESDESQWISLDARLTPDPDEDGEDTRLILPKVRRGVKTELDGNEENVVIENGTENYVSGDASEDKALSKRKNKKQEAVKERGLRESWWHTFKYRPILGIVPIGEQSGPLEVVLVERPSWDLDLPPRLVGNHERAL
ncbi:WD40 repeat-like protein [Mytilinidion resinicola]|uniref:WD40 repeat-like protein n=1 Tax=Mytilinidion resinicola TaxID=574789 RepID=A0A6A6Z2G1_9PEZI|nr:WD40 repeat-like protein [Mytilinidion resinicola]KAF2814863.1 WD40 repeat-like protein [Mytilinidion resinicola]